MAANEPGMHVVAGVLEAFKVARIVVGADGPMFAGAGIGGRYGPIDQAVCITNRQHVPPRRECGCGFYAWIERAHALALINEDRIAVLEVELWGRFDQYERAYIAAAQRVRRVTLFPFCVPCLAQRHPERQHAVTLGGHARHHDEPLMPLCEAHAQNFAQRIAIEELVAALGVEVRWAPEGDELRDRGDQMRFPPLPLPPPDIRLLDELLPGEVAHVFAQHIAQDDDGQLYIDVLARLVQALPGTDVPIRLNEGGEHEVLLTEVTDFTGWRARDDTYRFALPLRTLGQPQPRTDDEEVEAA